MAKKEGTPIFPSFYLESKTADIEAHRDNDIHYSWQLGEMLLTVEHIPDNWPCLTVSCVKRTVESMRRTLKEIGFTITGDEDSKR